MCIHSFVWAKGEGLGERLKAKKKSLGDLLSTLCSWRGDCFPIPPQIQGAAQLLAQIPGLPIAARCVPAARFSQLPPFFFQLLIQGYPYQVSPRFPHPASGLLWGIGDGIFLVSSQLGSPGNPENGRKKLGSFACTGFVCITSRNGQSHKVVPSLTPGWPPTLTVGY